MPAHAAAGQFRAESASLPGGKHQRVRRLRHGRFGLAEGEARRMRARRLASRGGFVDVGGDDPVGHDAEPGKQV